MIEQKDFVKTYRLETEDGQRLIDPTITPSILKPKGAAYAPSLYFVESVTDLPAAVAGVITLENNANYFIIKNIDLMGARLVCGQNTVLIGGSSENCIISSTGLDSATALISSEWSLPMRGLAISHGTALDLDANGNANQAIDWFGVNFLNCNTVGRIANYSNFIMTDSALLNSSGMEFDGTIGTVGFNQCLFDNRSGGTALIVPATANITRRLRVIYSSIIALSGETALSVSGSATIPVEGYILDTVNFSGGGTYLDGVQHTDNKALFVNNRGISNSAEIANYYMTSNATASDVIDIGVAVKIAGTTTSGTAEKFSHSDNRATYLGAITRVFEISAIASFTSGNGNLIGFYVRKNTSLVLESETYATANSAGRAENIAIQALVELSTNDYIEMWVENASATTDVTVEFLNVLIKSVN